MIVNLWYVDDQAIVQYIFYHFSWASRTVPVLFSLTCSQFLLINEITSFDDFNRLVNSFSQGENENDIKSLVEQIKWYDWHLFNEKDAMHKDVFHILCRIVTPDARMLTKGMDAKKKYSIIGILLRRIFESKS